ncbi:MAG TPA: pyridine nucleotide-disulfide oxidoreductase [Cytophagales bacterium]|nr:pyridine nucleotide-disulfide oxidoreductase [Cytophagales bacterium]
MSRYDVIIIGGSYAGLSAAMALGRSLRNVLVIDAGNPCNKQTPLSHNFITHDGATPANILAQARKQVEVYKTVQFVLDEAIEGKGENGNFEVNTKSGKIFQAKKLLFATGLKDTHEVKGFEACWGISVIHCPYCHGYEVRNKQIGVVSNGEHAFHITKLVYNLSKNVTVYTNGKSTLTDEQTAKLANRNIMVVEDKLAEAMHEQDHIKQLIIKNGERVSVDALFVKPNSTQHCTIPEKLGCKLTEHGFLQVDEMQNTTVAGIYAAGDNCTMIRSVAMAIAAGNKAGAIINMELTNELF